VSVPKPDPRPSGRRSLERTPTTRGTQSRGSVSRGPASRRLAFRGPTSRVSPSRVSTFRGPVPRGNASSLATVTKLPVRSPRLPSSFERARAPMGTHPRRAGSSDTRRFLDSKTQAARRARLTSVLCFLILVLGAFSAAGIHAITASEQLRLDSVEAHLQAQEALHTQLEQEVTSLSTPQRILSIAQGDLHMVLPTSVTFLQEVKPQDHQGTSQALEHLRG
jgi:cell division protein FtsL